MGLDGFVHGNVHSTKVCNQLTVQHNGVIVVDCGHALAVHASGYCLLLVVKHDFCGPKHLERVKRLDNSGAFSFADGSCLIFFDIHAAPLDEAKADIDNGAFGHCVSCAAGIRHTSE